jgi:predicted alpha/beta-hydrolase family hydrolase
VYGVLTDDRGDLWASTNKGLSRYTPRTNVFRNFGAGDGLQSDEFNRHAYCKDATGMLYFGGVNGLAFFGFPLHPAGKPSAERAKHLADVKLPMLFLQGTRDALAELDLLRPVVKGLGRNATLHLAEGADHSFHVLKSSGRNDREVLAEILDAFAAWAEGIIR